MKKTIRLNEHKLRSLIKESVINVLDEPYRVSLDEVVRKTVKRTLKEAEQKLIGNVNTISKAYVSVPTKLVDEVFKDGFGVLLKIQGRNDASLPMGRGIYSSASIEDARRFEKYGNTTVECQLLKPRSYIEFDRENKTNRNLPWRYQNTYYHWQHGGTIFITRNPNEIKPIRVV